MAGHWTKQFSFIKAAVRYTWFSYVAITDDNLDMFSHPHTGFVAWNKGEWNDGGRVPWPTVDISVCKHPLQQLVAVGPLGEVLLMGSGDRHEETISTAEGSPASRGQIRCVRSIDGRAYAAGMNRTVYRRDNANTWVTMEAGLPPHGGKVAGLEAIDGFSNAELYAVGRNGEVWLFDGMAWDQKASPTNIILNDVCCAGDGHVYACGRAGMVISGRGDTWSIVEQDLTVEDFWSIRWFRGELYLSTFRGVFVLRNGELLPVDMGEDQPSTCYHLSEADGVLWSIGKKDIMAFDGDRWTRID